MAITQRVRRELEQATPTATDATRETTRGRRRPSTSRQKKISPVQLTAAQRDALAAKSKGKAWSQAEHQRFLDALDLFPSGPWKAIADYVGTKNSRQTMTHAQKYREKHERHTRGLRTKSKKKKSSKKTATAKIPTRRMPRRRASRTTYCEDTATEGEEESDAKPHKLDAESLQEETHRCSEEISEVKAEAAMEVDDDTTDDFLSAFRDTCNEEDASRPSLPCVSSLTLPDSLIFASVDLWHSQSLAEMEADGDSTDLEDPAEFTVALSQECW